jgi:hypothetical protein
MALPKIMHAQFDILIPSLNKKMKFRQFLVKEEKILLVAKSSEEDGDILTAIQQVVQNCALDPTFDVDKIAVFDLEYIFLKLRALSITNIINLSYRDFEDDKVYDFEVNLDKITVEIPKKIDNTIMIDDKTGITMHWPYANIYSDKEFLSKDSNEASTELIIRCIDKVFDENNVYDPKTFSKQELIDFVEDLDVKTFEKINEFLSSAPKLNYVIKYKNSLDHDRQIVLSTLSDFFMLR